MKLAREILRVHGNDAEPFLQRMLTATLHRDGPGSYAALLEDNGSLVGGGFWIFQEGSWLCLTCRGMAETLRTGLARYIFFRDDVQLEVRTNCAVELTEDANGTFFDLGSTAKVAGVQWGPDSGTELSDDPCAVERRQNGIPVFGIEVRSGELLLEWDLGYALSQKGCYVGQEVVERMWSRHRRARGRILLQSPCPIPNGKIEGDGRICIAVAAVETTAGEWLALARTNDVPSAPLEWNVGDCKYQISRPVPRSGPSSLRKSYQEWCETE